VAPEFLYPHDGTVAAKVPRATASLPAGSYRATGFQTQYRLLLNHTEDTKSTREDDLQVFGMEISLARDIRRHHGDAGTLTSDSLDTEGHRSQALAQSQSTHTGDSPRPHHRHQVEAEMPDHGGGITSLPRWRWRVHRRGALEGLVQRWVLGSSLQGAVREEMAV
jgi:hypothetical protein